MRPVPIVAEAAAPNQHPVQLPADALRRLLAALRVAGGKRGEPLFTADELDALTPSLARCLAAARPDQDLVFAVQDHHGRVALFQGKTASAGRIFVADGRLNLLLGQAHYPAEQETKSLGWERPLRAGTRDTAADSPARIVVDAALPVTQPRPDWIAIPLERHAALPAVPTAAEPQRAAATRQDDVEARLEVLDGLRHKGRIDEEEYRAARREILLQR